MTTATKWRRSKVTLATRGEPTTITAHVYGHFAVHAPVSGGKATRSKYRVITHIPTGMSLTGYKPMDCLDGAQLCVEHLATLDIDWSKDNAALFRDHRQALKTVPREIDRYRDFALRRTFRL